LASQTAEPTAWVVWQPIAWHAGTLADKPEEPALKRRLLYQI